MNIPDNADLTNFDEFDIIDVTHEYDLNSKADDGWSLIAIGTNRPIPNSDGDFIDVFRALLGRKKSQYR